jgi:hypothetical protein
MRNNCRESDRSLKKSDRTLFVIIVGRAIAVLKKERSQSDKEDR